MALVGPRLIEALNRPLRPPKVYFGKLARSEKEAFVHALQAGQVVYEQLHGYNDLVGKTVLDFGCGRGGKTVVFAARGPRRTIVVDAEVEHRPALPEQYREYLIDFEVQVCVNRKPAPAAPLRAAAVAAVAEPSLQ